MNEREPLGFSEEALLARLASGDATAFTEIYRRYQDGLYNYLLKFTKNPAMTEDMVHDIFLKIWTIREKLDIKSSFSSYLFRFARNNAINQLKKIVSQSHLREEISHRVSLGIAEQPVMDAVQWQQYQHLLKMALNELSAQRRRSFELCRELGRSYEEAAAIMGISRNTLKQHLIDAVKLIKKYFLEHGDITLSIIAVLFL